MGDIRFTAIGHLFSAGVIAKQRIGSESLVQRPRQQIGRRTKTNVLIVQTPLQNRPARQPAVLGFFHGPGTYKWHVLDFVWRDCNGRFSALLSNLMFY
jgi:hypothetical protein